MHIVTLSGDAHRHTHKAKQIFPQRWILLHRYGTRHAAELQLHQPYNCTEMPWASPDERRVMKKKNTGGKSG
jgi:hypothetical protein